MKKTIFLLGLMVAAGPALAQNTASTAYFTQIAKTFGRLEIQTSHIAAKRGRTHAVRQFARSTISSRRDLEGKLAAALKGSRGVALPPATARQLNSEVHGVLKRVDTAPSADFDRTYLGIVVQNDVQLIEAYTNYVKNGKDAAVRSVAQAALPQLRHDLAAAGAMRQAER